MKKAKRSRNWHQVLTLVLIPLFLCACFSVRIKKDVKNPDRYFRRAYSRIERLQRKYPERRGPSKEFMVLIYDHSDKQLIQVEAPFWLVDSCMEIGIKASEDEEFDFEERYDFDWRGLRDLEEIGPGLLVEVEDDDNKILIWVE